MNWVPYVGWAILSVVAVVVTIDVSTWLAARQRARRAELGPSEARVPPAEPQPASSARWHPAE